MSPIEEETGYTAVFYATREGHLDILKLLLGAKVPRLLRGVAPVVDLEVSQVMGVPK